MHAAEIEFQKWPSIPRMNRPIIVTEKCDGTNAAVVIHHTDRKPTPQLDGTSPEHFPHLRYTVVDDVVYYVAAQSRKKFVRPGKQTDNAGFAGWVWNNAQALTRLGDGYHHGEWFGSKIQCGYGMTDGERKFMLFNSERWNSDTIPDGLSEVGVLPSVVLYDGPFSEAEIVRCLSLLREQGSRLVPGFDKPEGIVVWHTAAQQTFKVLLENDHLPKSLAL